MRKSHRLGLLAASVFSIGIACAYVWAQVPARPVVAPPRGGAGVALVDVSYIFKKHARFNAEMGRMKVTIERAEAEVRAESETIQKLTVQLRELNKGTQGHNDLLEEITTRRAKLSVTVQVQKDRFMQEEAKTYHKIYHEILQEVDYYAASNGIGLVLRFNGDPVDAGKPNDVLRQINKPVVWYNQGLDITKIVLDRLNGLGPGPNRDPRPADTRGGGPGMGVFPR